MLDLCLLSAELKKKNSDIYYKSRLIIKQIFNRLHSPCSDTIFFIENWKKYFKLVYGSIEKNLSSNKKFDIKALCNEYFLSALDKNEDVLLLIFAIQTFYSLLIKKITYRIVAKNKYIEKDIILGVFAQDIGITNYCNFDWYCWPLFELEHGFDKICSSVDEILDKISDANNITYNGIIYKYDYIKQIYETIIPNKIRHALGEYYTPEWLVEQTINDILIYSDKDISNVSFIDPTCGAGTFIIQIINRKKECGSNLKQILKTVAGFDINTLAVLTAKTNYILSILDILDGCNNHQIPVYNIDILKYKTQADNIFLPESENITNPVDKIACGQQNDLILANKLPAFDIVIGNPPWVNWEYLPEDYKKQTRNLWQEYNLFSSKGMDLSFSKEDISALITYIVMDKLLKDDGLMAFILKQALFKSSTNGEGFRQFKIKNKINIKVLKLLDLSKIKLFENVTVRSVIFYAQKGKINTYPVPYFCWTKKEKRCVCNNYNNLHEVMTKIKIKESIAFPAIEKIKTSSWITIDKDILNIIKKSLGTNNYKARTGVFTGGANGVYWLDIKGKHNNNICVENITKNAKRGVKKVSVELEDNLVYPMLKGRDIQKWSADSSSYILCPHTKRTKLLPIPKEELQSKYPETYSYLFQFKDVLDDRKGFAGWEKKIQKQDFHSILRVGDYTFSEYKVVWKYIASEFICAVVSEKDDKYLGKKTIIPNEKIMYVSFDDEEEAYFLCGILTSALFTVCVKSYMNEISISVHILNKLNIPTFDKNNMLHKKIAKICKKGHFLNNKFKVQAELDEAIAKLYNLTEDDTRRLYEEN